MTSITAGKAVLGWWRGITPLLLLLFVFAAHPPLGQATDIVYATSPVLFPVQTSVGHATITQAIEFSDGLGDPGDVFLSAGSSVGVSYGVSGLPFQQQTPNLPPFMAQYYPTCLTNRQMPFGDAVQLLPRLNASIVSLLSRIPAMLADITSANSWDFPFGCYNFSHTGASECGGIPFGILGCQCRYGDYCGGQCEGPDAGYNQPGAFCTPACSSSACATLPTVPGGPQCGCGASGGGDSGEGIPNCGLNQWSYAATPIGPPQQFLYGSAARLVMEIDGFSGSPAIGFDYVTPGSFISNPAGLGIDFSVNPDILNCMVDPIIASDGILPAGPPIPYDSVCAAIAELISLATVAPSYVMDEPITSPLYPALPAYCSHWFAYEAPTGPEGVAEFFYPTGGFWETSSTDYFPSFFSYNYSLTTSQLSLTGLTGSDFTTGQSLTIPLTGVNVMGPKSVSIPGSQISLYLPQDEGYYLYALDINTASRRRRGCFCMLLCVGLGGCGNGDISGLNRLKNQVVQLADTVATLASGVGAFETDTQAYVKEMSAQAMAFMDSTNGRFDAVWSGITALSQDIAQIQAVQLELEGLAQHFADQAYESSRSNTLALAQIKQQYGYRIGQLIVNVAVMRESLSLASLRSMQTGTHSSGENYCETINPLPFSLAISGTQSAPGLPECEGCEWGFGTVPSTGVITAFPTNVAGADCFISVISPTSAQVTWRVPTFDSSYYYLQDQGSDVTGPNFPKPSDGEPLFDSETGLPFYFRRLSAVKTAYSDAYFSVAAGECGSLGGRSPYPHIYVDLDTGRVYGSHDSIDSFVERAIGHPYLVDITDHHALSLMAEGLNGPGSTTALSYPAPSPNLASGPIPIYGPLPYPIRGLSLDFSLILNGNVTCPTAGLIDYSTYPAGVYTSSVILPDAPASLKPGKVVGSFASYVGLLSFRQIPPWSSDLIDSFVSGQGMGGAALVSQALAVALEAKLNAQTSALALSDALIQLASQTNQSLSATASSALANHAELLALGSVVTSMSAQLSSAAAAGDNTAAFVAQVASQTQAIATEHSTVFSALSSVNAQLSAQADQVAAQAQAVADTFVAQAVNLSAQSQADSARASAIALAVSRDEFSDKSSACSGFSDIGCMIATFLEYFLIIAAIALAAYAGVVVFRKASEAKASKTSPAAPASEYG